MIADSAVHPLPAYASFLHLLPLYASDATRPDHRIFNIALPLYDSITATLWVKAQAALHRSRRDRGKGGVSRFRRYYALQHRLAFE